MQTFFFFAKKVYKKGTFFVKKWYIKGQRGGPRGGTSPYKRGGGGGGYALHEVIFRSIHC